LRAAHRLKALATAHVDAQVALPGPLLAGKLFDISAVYFKFSHLFW
jgi:hypothetical protein